MSFGDKTEQMHWMAFRSALSDPWVRIHRNGELLEADNFFGQSLNPDYFASALRKSDEADDSKKALKLAIFKVLIDGKTNQFDMTIPDEQENLYFNIKIIRSGKDEVLLVCHELTKQMKIETDYSLANERMKTGVLRMNRRDKDVQYLLQFSRLISEQQSLDGILGVIRKYGVFLFPEVKGDFLVLKPRSGNLESIASWGPAHTASGCVSKDVCPVYNNQLPVIGSSPFCSTAQQILGEQSGEGNHFCMPVSSQEELFGILHLNWKKEDVGGIESFKQIAQLFSEQIARSLENLRLRTRIRNQAFKNPLTSLYNKQYFMEAMVREFYRVKRDVLPLSILLVNAKNLQDIRQQHGNEAFKSVLSRFSKLLVNTVRISDLVCHYEKDVFVVSLVGVDRGILETRLQEIYFALRNKKYTLEQDVVFINVMVSAAIFPDHGKTCEDLLSSAEKTLKLTGETGNEEYLITK